MMDRTDEQLLETIADLHGIPEGSFNIRKNGKLLPAVSPSALMYDANGSYVYVLDSENKVEKRYVTPGNSTPKFQLIKKGLAKGETVVARGTHKVLPGMTVIADFGEKG